MVARWVKALPLVVAIACSHPRLGPGESYDPSVITEDEIIASHATNAFDVIHKLRSNFLTNRGATSLKNTGSPFPTVYVDDQEFGPISTLSSIPAAQISMIRLYHVSEANAKYGTHNLTGLIAITT